MATFSEKDFNAERYFSFRPSYPADFYQLLSNYHHGPCQLLVDVGCGPGTATFQMASSLQSFQKVIGTDISPTMIEQAKQALASERSDMRVSFQVSPGDDFTFLGPEKSDKQICDMITAVECVHWFAFDAFQEAVAANLRSGGTIAIWGYADAIFVDYPDLDDILNDVAYGEDKLGPYWEQPGRHILRNMLRDRNFDKTKFTDVQEVYLQATDLRSTTCTKPDNKCKPLLIIKEMTLLEFAGYVKTWSAYHAWLKKIGNTRPNIVDELIERVLSLHPELSIDSKVRLVWNTFYKFARRI